MTDRPDWEEPVAGRRLPVWAWILTGVVIVAVGAQLARLPADSPVPGLPVEVVERPLPRPDLVPALRPVPHPSDRWEVLDPAPDLLSELGPAVWTGDALVAWSGIIEVRWEAEAGAWRVPTGGATVRRESGWTATWTGSEILYFGGVVDGQMPSDVWAYEPAANRWRLGADAPIEGRTGHAAVWDGQRLHVWGGSSHTALLSDGASYDPATGTWTVLPAAPLSPRAGAEAVWLEDTGELLVWGGAVGGEQLLDGAAYRPADGRWRPIPDVPWAYWPAPAAAGDGQRKLYLWGLPEAGLHLPDGIVYDAVENAWQPLPHVLLDQERAGAAATLIVDEGLLVVWGGLDRRLERQRLDGFVLDLATGRWRQIPPAPLPDLRDPHVAWSGHPAREGLLVWGARPGSGAAFYPAPLLHEPFAGDGATSR